MSPISEIASLSGFALGLVVSIATHNGSEGSDRDSTPVNPGDLCTSCLTGCDKFARLRDLEKDFEGVEGHL